MANNTFNRQRFLRTLRWDLLSNKKTTLRTTVGLTFGLALLYLFNIWTLRKSMETIASMGGGQHIDLWEQYDELASLTLFVILLVFCFSPSAIFGQMKTKQQRVAFLMLPASNLEKWLARFVSITIGTLCMSAVAVVGADLIRFIFALFITPGCYESVVYHLAGLFFTDDKSVIYINQTLLSALTLNFLGYSWVLLNHSFFTLGGSLFRRQPMMLTLASQFVIGFVLLLLGAKVAFNHFEQMVGDCITIDVNIHTNAETMFFVYTVSTVFLLLSALFYWLSYKLFTRMQVINNKWFNL